MQIYNWGWALLPIGGYMIIKNYFLHSGELWLLIYACILLFSTLLPSWITQITHLIIILSMSTHVLTISKQAYGHVSDKKYGLVVRVLIHLEEQLAIIVYMISAWLVLRVYTDKTWQFGIGTQYEEGHIFNGVNNTLCGWNCTQLEFVVIPGIWVISNTLSLLLGNIILNVQMDKDNLYKQYILKYLVKPYMVFSFITFVYNLYSYWEAQSLYDCVDLWKKYGFLMQLSVYYGFSVSTLYFFKVKKGVFLVQGKEIGESKEQKINGFQQRGNNKKRNDIENDDNQ